MGHISVCMVELVNFIQLLILQMSCRRVCEGGWRFLNWQKNRQASLKAAALKLVPLQPTTSFALAEGDAKRPLTHDPSEQSGVPPVGITPLQID